MKENQHPLRTIAITVFLFLSVIVFFLAQATLFIPNPNWTSFWNSLFNIIILFVIGGLLLSTYVAIERYTTQKDADYKSILDVVPFVVRVHWLMQGMLLFNAVVAGAASVWLLSLISVISLGGAIVALLFAWYCWALAKSTIFVDEQAITVKVPHGRFQLRWDEISRIVTDNALFSFQGNGKQLSTSLGMAGSGKAKFYDYLKHQIESRKIQIEHTAKVPLGHKNTRL